MFNYLNQIIMKTKMKMMLGSVLLTMVLVFASCGNSSSSSKEAEPEAQEEKVATVQYTCPMHPEVVKDEPGTCPECGMDLVVKNENTESEEMNEMHEEHME